MFQLSDLKIENNNIKNENNNLKNENKKLRNEIKKLRKRFKAIPQRHKMEMAVLKYRLLKAQINKKKNDNVIKNLLVLVEFYPTKFKRPKGTASIFCYNYCIHLPSFLDIILPVQ